MKTTFIRILLLAGFVVTGLSACNTVEGLSKDIKKGAEALEDAARKK